MKCHHSSLRLIRVHQSGEISERTQLNTTCLIEPASELWTAFDASLSLHQCRSCIHFQRQSVGGRPPKPKCGRSLKRKCAYDNSFSPPLFSTPKRISKTLVDSQTSPMASSSSTHIQTSPMQKTPKSAKVDTSTSPFTAAQTLGLRVRPVNEICHPLTKDDKKYATHLNRLKLAESKDGTVRCKTKGQPLVLGHIPQPRKATTASSSCTVRCRVKLLDRIRHNVSGNTSEDAIQQQGAEIRKSVKSKRKKILNAAGCAPVHMSKKQVLALRIKLGLTRGKHKHLRKILRNTGVALPSMKEEKQQQERAVSGQKLS